MTSRKNFFYTIFLSLILGGCAYATETSNQYITFETPGAQNARCSVYVNKLRYKVFPPQTINIKKSQDDMEIRCTAPGNRRVATSVPAVMSEKTYWGGPPGMAWDYASSSMYYYPSVIAIDFSQEELLPEKLPQHNNSDIRQPETYDLEEFMPGQPRLNSDKDLINTPLLRRGETMDIDFDEETPMPAKRKGDLQDVLEELTESQDSSDGMDESAESEPLPLYPGQ